MFEGTFWSVVPSIIAILLALILKEPHIALLIGAVIGALFCAGFAPVTALSTFIGDGIIQSIADNAGIIAFVVILGTFILIINNTNGAEAFGRWAARRIKTQRGATLATFVLGILIFIDDMFNCFTVSAVMTPVTDKNRISRQKLAWLLDATAAPVCMIAPISSWSAAVASTAEDLGNGMSGLGLFIRAIPYNYYSILTLVFIVAIGIMNFDYGAMKKYQDAAAAGDLGIKGWTNADTRKNHEEANADAPQEKSRAGIIDLVIPVAFLIIICVLSMMYVGGFFDPASDYFGDFAQSFGNTDGAFALSMGGLVALIFAVIFALCRKTISFSGITKCIGESFRITGSPLIILVLAVSLKNMTSLLGAREFLAMVMTGAAESLYSMLPAVIFIIAALFSFASGTSWGTFGVMIPIVAAVFPADSELLIIGISACLAGAVFGDHCSPISDTTIMSSAAAQCEHISHVETQLQYAATVAAISCVMYIIAGFTQNAVVCLIIGAVVTVGVLYLIKRFSNIRARIAMKK